MTLAALLRRILGRGVPPPARPAARHDPAFMPASAVPPPEPTPVVAPAPPLAPRRRRLTSAGWRRVLVDTAVLHWVRWDSRAARYAVLADAAGLPIADFMEEVKARHAAVLKRDACGRRPMEVEAFEARLRALACADPDAATRLDEVRRKCEEAERRAALVRQREKAAEKAAGARGLAAVLAASALVGRTMDAPPDPAPPPSA